MGKCWDLGGGGQNMILLSFLLERESFLPLFLPPFPSRPFPSLPFFPSSLPSLSLFLVSFLPPSLPSFLLSSLSSLPALSLPPSPPSSFLSVCLSFKGKVLIQSPHRASLENVSKMCRLPAGDKAKEHPQGRHSDQSPESMGPCAPFFLLAS